MKRRQAKKEAAGLARQMVELSVATSGDDMALAKKQAALARRTMLKFNIRLDWSAKRFYCHGCKQLMVPGRNARVRISSGFVRITCLDCGYLNRKSLSDKAGLNIQK